MIGPLPDEPCVHLDRGYDSAGTRDLLDELGYVHEIAHKGIPAPIQAGKRWVVERTHSWMNGNGKLRRCTEKRRVVAELVPPPRGDPHRPAPPHQPRPHPLPLANLNRHPPTQITIKCRSFLMPHSRALLTYPWVGLRGW